MMRHATITSLYNDNTLVITGRDSSDISFATMNRMGAYGAEAPAPVWLPNMWGRLWQDACFGKLAVQWPNKPGEGRVFAGTHAMTVNDLTDPTRFEKIAKDNHAKHTI